MQKVDFFLLAADAMPEFLHSICQYLEDGYKQKQRYYVHTSDQTMSHQLDELLWSFDAVSFVPHQLMGEGALHPAPVLIGHDDSQVIPKSQFMLMNLNPVVPQCYKQFRHIIDMSPHIESALEHARIRYKFYKTHGLAIQYHDLRKEVSLSP